MASTEDGFTINFLFVKSSELFIPRSDQKHRIKIKNKSTAVLFCDDKGRERLHLFTFKKVKVLGAGAGGFNFTHSEPEPAQNAPAPKHCKGVGATKAAAPSQSEIQGGDPPPFKTV